MSDITIFDKILAGEIPAKKVYEDDHVLAFEDISAQAPVHVLVIPKQKMVSFADVKANDPAVMGAYMVAISKVADSLGLEEGGYRVVFNHGENGGQTVSYIHAHILGGRSLSWPPG